MIRVLALLGAVALPGALLAQGIEGRMGRYQPLHPGLYLQAQVLHDPRDQSFDASGVRRHSIAPGSGDSQLPLTTLRVDFEWHLPLFEEADLPFFSTRTHRLRIGLQQGWTRTDGALAGYVAAEGLKNAGSGLGNLELAFGSFLVGGEDWRSRENVPRAVLLEWTVVLPTGVYERMAPTSVGDNRWAFGVDLGGLLRPWRGALLEAGVGYRRYGTDHEPAFGALMPADRGDELRYSASLSQRLHPGWHLALHLQGTQAGRNVYRDPRFTPDSPPAGLGAESRPLPGEYRDEGTRSLAAGASLYVFATPYWRLGAHVEQPLSGRSGVFDLPHVERRPAGCIPGAALCSERPGAVVRTDGMGSARQSASLRFGLSLSRQFGAAGGAGP